MEKLSENNWIEIFSYLHPKDIENAADSCQTWRNIITNTPSLMQKLLIYINSENVEGGPWMNHETFYQSSTHHELFQPSPMQLITSNHQQNSDDFLIQEFLSNLSPENFNKGELKSFEVENKRKHLNRIKNAPKNEEYSRVVNIGFVAITNREVFSCFVGNCRKKTYKLEELHQHLTKFHDENEIIKIDCEMCQNFTVESIEDELNHMTSHIEGTLIPKLECSLKIEFVESIQVIKEEEIEILADEPETKEIIDVKDQEIEDCSNDETIVLPECLNQTVAIEQSMMIDEEISNATLGMVTIINYTPQSEPKDFKMINKSPKPMKQSSLDTFLKPIVKSEPTELKESHKFVRPAEVFKPVATQMFVKKSTVTRSARKSSTNTKTSIEFDQKLKETLNAILIESGDLIIKQSSGKKRRESMLVDSQSRQSYESKKRSRSNSTDSRKEENSSIDLKKLKSSENIDRKSEENSSSKLSKESKSENSRTTKAESSKLSRESKSEKSSRKSGSESSSSSSSSSSSKSSNSSSGKKSASSSSNRKSSSSSESSSSSSSSRSSSDSSKESKTSLSSSRSSSLEKTSTNTSKESKSKDFFAQSSSKRTEIIKSLVSHDQSFDLQTALKNIQKMADTSEMNATRNVEESNDFEKEIETDKKSNEEIPKLLSTVGGKENNTSEPPKTPENIDDNLNLSYEDFTSKLSYENVQKLYPWIDVKITSKLLKTKTCHESLLTENSLYSTFKCMSQTCKFYTTDIEDFKTHLNSYIDVKHFCCFCLKSFDNPNELCSHIDVNHKFDRLQCNKCMFRACQKGYVDLHQKRFHKNEENCEILKSPVQCFMKKERNEEIAKLKANREKFVMPFRCRTPNCFKIFFSKNNFKTHLHSESKKLSNQEYGSVICEQIYELNSIRHSNTLDANNQCLFCRFGNDSEEVLLEHLAKNHPSNLAYVCKRKIRSDVSDDKTKINNRETLESHTTIEYVGECSRKTKEFKGDKEILKSIVENERKKTSLVLSEVSSNLN